MSEVDDGDPDKAAPGSSTSPPLARIIVFYLYQGTRYTGRQLLDSPNGVNFRGSVCISSASEGL